MRDADRPPLDRVADAASVASDFGAVWTLLSIAQVATRRASARTAAARLGAVGVTSLLLTRLLKRSFAVERPPGATSTRARTPTSTSFPSGHTLAAFAAALVVPRSHLGRVAALGFATLVGWARVRVGHHRPGDVLAGAAAGAIAGAVVMGALRTAPAEAPRART